MSERNDPTAMRLKRERPKTVDRTGAGVSGKEYGHSEGQIGDLKDIGIVSPPYSEAHEKFRKRNGILTGDRSDLKKYMYTKGVASFDSDNIANLKDVGIVSPVYSDTKVGKNSKGIDIRKNYETYRKSGGGMSFNAYKEYQEKMSKEYSSNPDNIANLKDVGIVSPPYSNRLSDNDKRSYMDTEGKYKRPNTAYGDDANQIGNLKDVGIVSPPYSEAISEHRDREIFRKKNIYMRYSRNKDNQIGNFKDAGIVSPPYGNESVMQNGAGKNSKLVRDKFNNVPYTDETVDYESRRNPESGRFDPHPFRNVGKLKDSDRPEGKHTYLEAMYQVYSEAYKAGISPLVVVTKNPTRNHKLRRLDIDTARLLEMVGYRIVDYHQAVLFTEHRQKTLFGEEKVDVKGRISFFKLLSIRNGNVAADHEDIIIAVKE